MLASFSTLGSVLGPHFWTNVWFSKKNEISVTYGQLFWTFWSLWVTIVTSSVSKFIWSYKSIEWVLKLFSVLGPDGKGVLITLTGVKRDGMICRVGNVARIWWIFFWLKSQEPTLALLNNRITLKDSLVKILFLIHKISKHLYAWLHVFIIFGPYFINGRKFVHPVCTLFTGNLPISHYAKIPRSKFLFHQIVPNMP